MSFEEIDKIVAENLAHPERVSLGSDDLGSRLRRVANLKNIWKTVDDHLLRDPIPKKELVRDS